MTATETLTSTWDPVTPFMDLNRRDFSSATYWGPDTIYNIASVGVFRGREQITGYFEEMLAAMPDLVVEVERTVEDGEVVVVQWNAAGTFGGAALQGFAPTGGRLIFRGCDVIDWDGEQIRTNNVYADGAHMARQIGVLPPQGSLGERTMQRAFNAQTRMKRRLR